MQIEDAGGAHQCAGQARDGSVGFRRDPVAKDNMKRAIAGRPDGHSAWFSLAGSSLGDRI